MNAQVPLHTLCPACRKRGVLSVMAPVEMHGQLAAIKWNCTVCDGAYGANMEERGTIRPYGKEPKGE